MLNDKEQRAINKALNILESHLRVSEFAVTSPDAATNFLQLKLALREREIFAVMFLDNHNRLIEYKELFTGTIDGAAVYPRVVVQEALRLNAAAVLIAHNHPSGVARESEADKQITRRLQQALELVDVRVLDHIIIAGKESRSFAAERLL